MRQSLSRVPESCLFVAAAIVAVTVLTSCRRAPPAVIPAAVAARVEVKFDQAHVAHVFARTREDAAFAIGFVHAQRRGWQLQLAKRLVHGRLSEVAGRRALGQDELMRRLRLREVARSQFALLPRDEQSALEAYARGVNAVLHRFPASGLPFQAVERLEWEPADCIGWSLFMALRLSGNWQSELDRLHLSRTLDWSDVLLLVPGNSIGDGVPLRGGEERLTFPSGSLRGIDFQPRDATGSNSWAVTGERSRSGSPLLANDPHLPLTVPSPWFLARISVDGDDPALRQDVIGLTSPGLPMVLIGRTEHVAWGITRNGADTQDLYVEEVDPSNDRRYRVGTGWAEFARHAEQIRVRGEPPVTVVVDASRHGPIVGESPPSHADAGDEGTRRLALRWSGLVAAHAGSISAAFAANRARACGDLIEAFASHVAPVQNVLAADSGGRLCFRVVGRIPKRTSGHPGGGLLPAPGRDDASLWNGWLSDDEMPTLDDAAARGHTALADANQQLRMPGAEAIAGEWDLPDRHRRILDLLSQRPAHDARSFQAMQYDTRSYEAAQLLPVLMRARPQGALATAAFAEIAGFDGDMRADSAAALVFTAWMDELTRTVLTQRLDAAHLAALYGRRLFRPAVERILLDDRQGKKWCASDGCIRELTDSLGKAVEKLARAHGSDVRSWRWGRAHPVRGQDFAATGASTSARPFEVGGDPWTVNMTHHEPSQEAAMYPTLVGANVRLVHDLADRNASWFVQFGGPDEFLASGPSRRFALAWQEGRYSELRFEPRGWIGGFALQPQRRDDPGASTQMLQ